MTKIGEWCTRLSILALLTPVYDLHPSVRKQSKENLHHLPDPGDQKIRELLPEPNIHPFPDLQEQVSY